MDEDKYPLAMYDIRTLGQQKTLDYRVYFAKAGQLISPFHDIPLYVDDEHKVLNMVVEIPRWTNAKFEISRNEPLNPIKQDEYNGKPRYTHNCFPYKGYLWNYGALPQTCEDPNITHSEIVCRGDNDPLDACEIGSTIAKCGEVKMVKALGALCLIDDGNTDWKIIVIDIRDPLASKIHSIEGVTNHMPKLLEATKDWFQIPLSSPSMPPEDWAFISR